MKKLVLLLSACIMVSVTINSQSPFINKVYDFMPAPGQFVNKLPEYEEGNNRDSIIKKVGDCIVGDEAKILVSLGAYGGYVVFGFDHMVENRPGKYDFKIWGNAFYANANPNTEASPEGGSCEPGIVMVAHDANNNGLPDDPWYELAGSEYYKTRTIKNYRLTYYKPDANKTPTPDQDYPFLNDTTYIKWKSNQGDSGYVSRNTFHSQSYYPNWETGDSLVFEGTKLNDNYIDESGVGRYFVQYAYHWGYVDNHPNNNDRSGFNIEWAIDSEGNPVTLSGIHFVKVYTGVNQYCGWLGETSTEIMGAEDLHIQNIDISVPTFVAGISIDTTAIEMTTNTQTQLIATISPANANNQNITWKSSDTTIVKVNNTGLVTALNIGEAVVKAIAHDGYYISTCNVEVVSGVGLENVNSLSKPYVYYAQNQLHLANLAGYRCFISSATGQLIEGFHIYSANESRYLNLSSGVYILNAQKQNELKTIKFSIP